jgi:hypothetical protein
VLEMPSLCTLAYRRQLLTQEALRMLLQEDRCRCNLPGKLARGELLSSI